MASVWQNACLVLEQLKVYIYIFHCNLNTIIRYCFICVTRAVSTQQRILGCRLCASSTKWIKKNNVSRQLVVLCFSYIPISQSWTDYMFVMDTGYAFRKERWSPYIARKLAVNDVIDIFYMK